MAKRGHGEGTVYRHKKSGKWMAQASIGYGADGKLKRITKYFETRKDAQDWLTKVAHEKNIGAFVEPDKITLGDWLDKWLNTYKKARVRKTTWDNYETMIRCHIKPAIGHIPLQKLQAGDLQGLYNQKLKEEKSSSLVHRLSLIINGALKQALKEQLVYRNVNDATELPPLKYKEIQPLTAEQVQKFLEVAEQDRLYAAYLLELGTGLRRGELLALRWQDLDLENGRVFVNQTVARVRDENGPRKTKLEYNPPKTEKSKASVPIPENIVWELVKHQIRQQEEKGFFQGEYQDNGLVFCSENGGQLDPRAFTRRYERLLKKAGIPKTSFHNLRHTFATLLLEAGEEMKTVQELLRHARLNITADIYTTVTEKLKKKASAKINDILFNGKPGRE
ncbi:MAG: site-specific integrase [Armatimonadetes bacterium]|nr:site-specific integrase [Armatimonadota bacterium]